MLLLEVGMLNTQPQYDPSIALLDTSQGMQKKNESKKDLQECS